jgi:hypothetical protein
MNTVTAKLNDRGAIQYTVPEGSTLIAAAINDAEYSETRVALRESRTSV